LIKETKLVKRTINRFAYGTTNILICLFRVFAILSDRGASGLAEE
jgi:hypothetical protein